MVRNQWLGFHGNQGTAAANAAITSLVCSGEYSWLFQIHPWYIHLAFFALSGLVWVLPAMGVISWMEKKPKDPGDQLTR